MPAATKNNRQKNVTGLFITTPKITDRLQILFFIVVKDLNVSALKGEEYSTYNYANSCISAGNACKIFMFPMMYKSGNRYTVEDRLQRIYETFYEII